MSVYVPTNSRTQISTFADDTTILSVHKNPKEASKILQNHILDLKEWLKKWKIKVNVQKCIHITFTLCREFTKT